MILPWTERFRILAFCSGKPFRSLLCTHGWLVAGEPDLVTMRSRLDRLALLTVRKDEGHAHGEVLTISFDHLEEKKGE